MAKLFSVAWNEFRRHALKGSFILVLLSVPLMLSLIIGLVLIMTSLENNDAPVGYVDLAGFLDDPVQAPYGASTERIEIRAFQSETAARQALEAGVIQAYYVFAPDYLQSSQAALFYEGKVGENVGDQFYDFLQANFLRDFPSETAARVAQGSEITIRSPDGTRVFPAAGPQIGQVLPIIIALAFIFLISDFSMIIT